MTRVTHGPQNHRGSDGGPLNADDIPFDDSVAGTGSSDVQGALVAVALGGGGGGGVTDHGLLTGLLDDDHTQYQKESEKGAANGYASLGAGGLVPIGQLASGTPDGTKFVRDDGVLATPPGGGGGSAVVTLNTYFDSGGGLLTALGYEVYHILDFAATIQAVTLIGVRSGTSFSTLVLEVEKASYANYPTFTSITGSAKPTLGNDVVKAQDTTLAGWNTAIAAGDILHIFIQSTTFLVRATLGLKLLKT